MVSCYKLRTQAQIQTTATTLKNFVSEKSGKFVKNRGNIG